MLTSWIAGVASFLQATWQIDLVVVLGAIGIYLLLPRPRPLPAFLGASFGTAALVLTAVLLVSSGQMLIDCALFYLFSGIAIVAGTLLLTQHHPAKAALSFTLVILSTCGLFLLLAAPFLMAATIIIYAGAIVVTFLFVLMLAQQAGLGNADARSREPLFSVVAGFVLLGTLLWVLQGQFGTQTLDRELDPLLKTAMKARTLDNAKEINEALGENEALFRDFRNALAKAGQNDLHDLVYNEVQTRWPGNKEGAEEEMKQRLTLLISIGQQARAQVGMQASKASGKDINKMSNLSGPPGITPARDLRTDPDSGIPLLPAENSTYLGRSLFTDYLLPVELGGFLLLVAVVGSIAIAQRSSRPETQA